jgi:hypothetical protein
LSSVAGVFVHLIERNCAVEGVPAKPQQVKVHRVDWSDVSRLDLPTAICFSLESTIFLPKLRVTKITWRFLGGSREGLLWMSAQGARK